MSLHLKVWEKLPDGSISQAAFYTDPYQGWTKNPGDWFLQRALARARLIGIEHQTIVHVSYLDGPIVAGFVPNIATDK